LLKYKSIFDPSIKDLQKADNLGYEDPFQNVLLAQNFLQLDCLDIALSMINIVVQQNPELLISYKIKGNILYKKGAFEASAISWEKAISLSIRKLPEDYCSAAESWQATKTKEGISAAFTILNEGLNYYKLLPSLLLYKRDLALNNQKFELAITTQLIIIEQSNRKEFPYYDMVLIYQRMGDPQKVKNYWNLSWLAISELPPHGDNNVAVKNLG
jgi:tetratricopeptide (TPR) repeat protein